MPATARLALLGIAATWGLTFVIVEDALAVLPPLTLVAWRFLPAALVVAAVTPRGLARLPRQGWGAGAALGLLQAATFVSLTAGLAHTGAARAGFLCGLHVLATPVLAAALLRDRGTAATWLAALAAATGLFVLAGAGGGTMLGDALVLAAAVGIAAHLLLTGRVAQRHDAAPLVAVQLGVGGLVVLAAAVVAEGAPLPTGTQAWAAIALVSLLATAGAFWVQTATQRHVPAAQAALVLAAEPVFAAVFAVLLGGEAIAATTMVGGGLVVVAGTVGHVPVFGR